MKLILVRHGATEWSVTGQHTGRTDIPLTELGRAQAAAAAPLAASMIGTGGVGRIISSPLSRALETARIVFPDAEIETSDDLLEFDYGDYEGLTPSQIRDRQPGWDLWEHGCPNGEAAGDVGARIDDFLAMVDLETEPVVAVAHGHLLRILAARAVGLTAQQGQVFTLDTATVSCVEDVRGKRVVRYWNLPATFASNH